jgi:hypothetical protein
MTADDFPSDRLDLATRQRFAAEHNAAAGFPDAASPPPPPATQPTRLPQPVPSPTSNTPPSDAALVKAEKAQLYADYMAGKIDSRTYTDSIMRVDGMLPEITRQSGLTRSDRQARHNEEQIDTTQEAFERSVERGMTPARSPNEYNIPLGPNPTDEELQADRIYRQMMFDAKLPREDGSSLAQSMKQTENELKSAARTGDPHAHAKVLEGYGNRLRARWGADFQRRVDVVDQYLEGEARRSPAVRALLTNVPEVFSGPDTMHYLYRRAGAA